jgi:hypothetical protein
MKMRQLNAGLMTVYGVMALAIACSVGRSASDMPPDRSEGLGSSEATPPRDHDSEVTLPLHQAPENSLHNGSSEALAPSSAATQSKSDPTGASTTPEPKPGCKRGIAANVAPGAAFSPAVKWWYNWAIRGETDADIEFVPMIWGRSTAGDIIPDGSKYLLGFNEPNFFDQADSSARGSADAWQDVERSAGGVPVVGPGMNFCGPAERCHDTNPYQYLKDFFASCDSCQVDYVAVHWYNCDLPSLRDYLEPGGNLEGFEQFGVPIWITEFSCNPSASMEEQEAFMREAIPYLESNPQVFRYSWFSAGPIPNARLIHDDGTPTTLGEVYINLDQEGCE